MNDCSRTAIMVYFSEAKGGVHILKPCLGNQDDLSHPWTCIWIFVKSRALYCTSQTENQQWGVPAVLFYFNPYPTSSFFVFVFYKNGQLLSTWTNLLYSRQIRPSQASTCREVSKGIADNWTSRQLSRVQGHLKLHPTFTTTIYKCCYIHLPVGLIAIHLPSENIQ